MDTELHPDSLELPPRKPRPGQRILTMLLAISIGPSLLWSYARVFAGSDLDERYAKVSSPRADSMIIGGSRGSADLIPSKFDEETVNFAFGLGESPYGEVYYRAIQRKLKNGRGGLFILDVCPHVLSAFDGQSDWEKDRMLGQLYVFSGNPNFDYLFRIYNGSLWKLAFSRDNSGSAEGHKLHADGWREWPVPAFPEDQRKMAAQAGQFHRTLLDRMSPSAERIEWFRRTCALLRERGDIVIVRLPIIDVVKQLEEVFWPEFNEIMIQIAQEYDAEYIDLSDEIRWRWTSDGTHLNKRGAEVISTLLAERLNRSSGN